MSYLIAAVGAVLAALVETSVFPEIRVAGVNPDLVLVFTIVAGMFVGVEEGLVWAFLGGLMLDLLTPGNRPIGVGALDLLFVAGLVLLIARVTQPPRVLTVVVCAFALTFLYQALLEVLLAATANVGLVTMEPTSLAIDASLNAILAAAIAWVTRGLYLRFGPAERTDW